MKERADVVPKQLVYLLFVCVALLAILSFLPQSLMPFTSAEINFFDESSNGLKILPASCASNPGWWHNTMPYTGATNAYYVPSTNLDYGATLAGVNICVINNSGASLFVPGGSAAEINNLKAHVPAGVTVY